MATRDDLGRIAATVRDRFEAQKRVLSFEEYLDRVYEHPARHTRDAAALPPRLLRPLRHRTNGASRGARCGAFDCSIRGFEAGERRRRRRDHLVGQEALQEVGSTGSLENFVREGRANRLMLLHGPNGSAKTTFAACLMRALEHYSTHDDGALYRFCWIFPRGRDGKTIGFGSLDEPAPPGRDVRAPARARRST